jgi:4-amino-4-deoxy-L-arabinose transferase-like glycosyltransferase
MTSRSLLLVVLIVLLALAARLYGIQSQSIWFDEGWSAFAAVQPSLTAAANADATNPPLYYVLLNVSTTFLGDSEFSLRLFSLFWGLIVVALSYRLGRQLFGTRAGLYAAFLTACSPLLWWASQEARMYTLLAALVLLCVLVWQRLLTRPSRKAWLILWAAELALLYAHNTGPVIVLWLNVVTVIAWIGARRLDRPFHWKVWLSGQALVALLWAPYFFSRFLNLGEANRAVSSAPQFSAETVLQVWQAFWQTPWERVRLSGEPPLPYLALLIAFVLLVPWRRTAGRWLVLHALLLTAGLVVALMVLGNELHGRYLVMVVPLLLAALGAGIARLHPLPLRLLSAGVAAALFFANLVYAQTSDYRHDDARAMAQYYANTLDANDTVLAWSYADRYELAYYWDRLGVQARRVTLPEGADLDTVLPLLPESGDVALNVWYAQRADYRRMMECLLGSGTVTEPESYTVYGMSSLLYRHPWLRLPQLTASDLAFSENNAPLVSVSAHSQIVRDTADEAQCLPIQITLLRDTDVNLKAALIVQNDLGWEIARADAAFATADQRESGALPAGATLSAYPLLRLPYGAPPGTYRVFLRIYDEVVAPSGYEPPAVVTNSGRDVLLAIWDVWRGAQLDAATDQTRLPTRVNIPVTDDLTLAAHDGLLENSPAVVNGREIRLSLLWNGTGTLPTLTLVDTEGRWSVDILPYIDAIDNVTLDWRAVRVPAAAPSGTAELRLPDGTVIARYAIESLPMNVEMPAVDVPVRVEFPGVGALVGYRLTEPITLDSPPTLTLVWYASAVPADVSYTVFAQLLNDEGRVIAQSDSLPASGARPTTGWRIGEYIEDTHRLVFNDLAAPGEVRLIIGLYNPANNQRLLLEGGQDFVALAEGIVVR